MEWTEDTIQRLRALWQEGHSTAEIGRRMGISKNAVVGKAHRLELPARPSPIRRESAPRAPRPVAPRPVVVRPAPRVPAPPAAERTVSQPAAAPAGNVVSMLRAAVRPDEERTVQPRRADPFTAAPKVAEGAAERVGERTDSRSESRAERSARRLTSCSWPLGDPGTKSFRFCGCETVPGKPYCLEHAQLAYVRIKDRREIA